MGGATGVYIGGTWEVKVRSESDVRIKLSGQPPRVNCLVIPLRHRRDQNRWKTGKGVGFQERPVPLSYRLLDGQDTLPPVVFLHGMFSNKNIFQAEAEALAQKTGRKVLTVDARNHGESPHNPDCSYEAMSSDLQDILLKLGLTPCVLIGHSMGGKTAMAFALQKPELVERLVSVDVSPLVLTGIPKVFKIVPVMNSINLLGNLSDSQAFEVIDEYLKLFIKDASIRQYLFNSLVRVNGKYVWKVNAENLWQQQQQLLDPPPTQGVYHGPTLFLTDIDSPYIPLSHHHKIKLLFPKAQFQAIPDAGHIIHIKKPQEFMNSILSFLS
ncbi:sn-1-specific diacylglycerol lipase ABHD11-like [Notamacropus eugenii]|uniref:sn-1-specific diacylglycerol lipase ABHD11-like n=1 Tax=Notamacropus eugenii TaxID=9315 RepID=UPI003B6813BC